MAIENIIKGEPDWHLKINNNIGELNGNTTLNANKIGNLTTDVASHSTQLSDIVQEQTTQNANIGLKANQNALDTTNANVANNTATISTHTSQIATNTSAIASLASGSPKGVYTTLALLQTAFPTGNTNTYIVSADGCWYYWNGSAWTSGGIYQSISISDNAVSEAKLKDLLSADLFTYTGGETGGYYAWNYVWTASAGKNVSARIPVSYLDVVKFDIKSTSYKELIAFDSSGNCVYYNSSALNASTGAYYFTISNKAWAYISVQNDISANGLLINSVKKFASPNWTTYLFNQKIQSTTDSINTINTTITGTKNAMRYNYVDHDSYVVGTYSKATPPVFASDGLNVYKIYTVAEGQTLKIHPYGNPYIAVYFCTNDSGTFISGSLYTVSSYNNTYQTFTVPTGATKLYVACEKNCIDYTYVERYGINKNPTQWNDKSAVIFGTSIPAGFGAGINGLDTTNYRENSYPLLMAHYLSMTITNEAVGSSCVCCRKQSLVNPTTNPYGFINNFEAVSRCLTNTIEQMQWIANWINYKINSGTYGNSGTYDSSVFTSAFPTTWTTTDTNYIKSYSYENKLVVNHLGNNRKDLYIFEHGHNDIGTDNFTTDTTGSNGMFSYSGCMNFLINLILTDNPRTKIVIMSHYDNQKHTGVNSIITAQKNVADYWEIPFLSLYDKLGMSQGTIKTTGYWDVTGYSDGSAWWVASGGTEQTISMVNLWLPDGTHPHTDKSGKANRHIAKQASELLKTVSVAY